MEDNKVRYQFFKHYFNARQDQKLTRLLMKEGWAGIGIWWALLEMLGPIEDHRAKCDYEAMSWDFRVEPDTLKRIIEDYGLFVVEDGYFMNRSFTAQMNELSERYKRRAAAGALGGKAKRSNAKPSTEQQDSKPEAIREEENKEIRKEKNNKDISPSNEADLSLSETRDDETKFFDDRILDNKYIEIVKAYMCKGAAKPSEEATHLIDMFAPSWVTKDGRNFEGREGETTQFWQVPRERKYIDGPRLNVAGCRAVDIFISLILAARIRDVRIIDAYRLGEYDKEKNLYTLYISDIKAAHIIEKEYLKPFAEALRSMFGSNVQLTYKLYTDR